MHAGTNPDMPRTIFKDGITTLTNLNHTSIVGIMLIVIILSLTDDGQCSIPDSLVGRMIPKHGKKSRRAKINITCQGAKQRKDPKDPKPSESKSRVKVIFRVTETRK